MSYDYIIIGSGIAGLYSALLAREHGSVLLLTKETIDECNTKYAQGGIAAVFAEHDSPREHFEDTLRAGDGLCDPEAVAILVEDGPARVRDLIQLGVGFDRVGGQIVLTKEGGHSTARILHANGDSTGACIERTLSERVRVTDMDIWERQVVTKLEVQQGRCVGVHLLDVATGMRKQVEGRCIILATGGAGQIYRHTTNPAVATGDGLAVALEAGAELVDMEFMQFHPTALNLPGQPHFLISETVRGEGATLLDEKGFRFMPAYDPRAELASRDIVSRAIWDHMARTNADHVYIDFRHVPAEVTRHRFPSIWQFTQSVGLNMSTDLIPVAPAAHYMVGGVRTDGWGRTSIPGLYACGEVACTGVHGANRLGSNSLLEAIVFARRIQLETLNPAPRVPLMFSSEPAPVEVTPLASAPPPSRRSLQELMWRSLGIVREGSDMASALRLVNAWLAQVPTPHDRASFELRSSLVAAKVMVASGLLREESRGCHFRKDYPEPRDEWLKRIVLVRQVAGQLSYRFLPHSTVMTPRPWMQSSAPRG